jgi:hypothetical protein
MMKEKNGEVKEEEAAAKERKGETKRKTTPHPSVE